MVQIIFCCTASAQTSITDTSNSNFRVRQELNKRDSILLAAKQRHIQDSIDRILQQQKMIEYRDSLKLAIKEKRKQDSIAQVLLKEKLIAERKTRDSIREADRLNLLAQAEKKKKEADSLASVRKATADSLLQARLEQKRIQDALNKYKNSKHYKDSVMLAKKNKMEDLKRAREDALLARKLEQKNKLDSMKVARELESKMLKDERDRKLDSAKLAQKNYLDSMKSAQSTANELLKQKRKNELDSLKLAQTKYNDSLKLERKKSLDSLVAARKAGNSKESKTSPNASPDDPKKKKSIAELQKEKAREIHARKQGSWTNEQLLKRNWSIHRKIYQNTVTRYNSYYNAKLKYDGAMDRLKEKHKDVYTEPISIYPYNLESAAGAVGSDMDTVVKKCAFDTQIHDPRSKWFDNVYLLMGKAFFFKNDYESAITAFQYVVNEYKDDKNKKKKKGSFSPPTLNNIKFDSKNKILLASEEKRGGLHTLEHHEVRNDALVWLIRTYIQSGSFNEASSLISILTEDPNFPERLKGALYISSAELKLKQNDKLSAIEPLKNALEQKSLTKEERQRCSYLLAQLYTYDNNIEASNKYFQEALKEKLPLEMEYFTQLNLASNTLKGVGDKNVTIQQLEKIGKEEKFSKWRGQTYLTLGQILTGSDNEQALKYLNKSLEQTGNSNYVKAEAFSQLGKIYFDSSAYSNAKTAYDSAMSYGQTASPPLSNIEEVKLRKEVLEDLVKYTDIIRVEDSLQTLSKKSKAQQMAAIDEELKRRRKEEKRKLREQANELTAVALTPGNFGRNSWYFYNNNVVQTGIIEFESKWGKRPLVDNWRRSNSNASQLAGGNNNQNSADSGSQVTESNSTEAQKMLDALYTKPEQFSASEERLVNAYYQLALIYSSRLNDYKRSNNTYNILVQRFPENEFIPNSYYGLYLNHDKLKETSLSTKYKNLLLTEHPNSQFAKLLRDPSNTVEKNNSGSVLIAYYDTTYNIFLEADYKNAINRAVAGQSKFPESELAAKFDLIHAQALAGMQMIDSARNVTEEIIKKYPNTEEQLYAQNFLTYLKSNNQLKPGIQAALNNNSNQNSNNNTANSSSQEEAVYTYTPNTTHYLLIYLKQIDGNSLGLKSGFSDFNMMRFADKKYKTNMNLLDRSTAVISINEFSNAKAAQEYRKEALKEKNLFRNLTPSGYDMAIISAENFKELLKTRKIQEYLKFFAQKY